MDNSVDKNVDVFVFRKYTRTVMSTNGKIVINSKFSMWTATCKLYDDCDNKDNYVSFYIFSKWKLGYMARMDFMFSDMW
jgi:hypothetical protein